MPGWSTGFFKNLKTELLFLCSYIILGCVPEEIQFSTQEKFLDIHVCWDTFQ